jgi:hypothetical protein
LIYRMQNNFEEIMCFIMHDKPMYLYRF